MTYEPGLVMIDHLWLTGMGSGLEGCWYAERRQTGASALQHWEHAPTSRAALSPLAIQLTVAVVFRFNAIRRSSQRLSFVS